MRILAIETSCDDTCAAVVEVKGNPPTGGPPAGGQDFEILSNIISSQVKLHAKYGGVFPSLAKREHLKNLPLVVKQALTKAGNPKIDFIAVTQGPGLEPCLWTGINFAKDLAEKTNLPVVPVNHIEAHILANFIDKKIEPDIFPAVCLVVSGGHTQLILIKNSPAGKKNYKILGETRDDAAGECFDKIARILGLGYPGGPKIAAEAAKLKSKNPKLKVHLPRPMIHQKNYDFSFSGLKTAVLYDFKNRPEKIRESQDYKKAIAREAQQAIIDVLIAKTAKAVKNCKAKSLVLGGGVASNDELRKQLKARADELKINFLVPAGNFCTDNAAMIAITAYFQQVRGEKRKTETLEADANQALET